MEGKGKEKNYIKPDPVLAIVRQATSFHLQEQSMRSVVNILIG
jgi:hypothetical protein